MADQAQLQPNSAGGQEPAPAATVEGGAGGQQTSLYVGDLDVNVSDEQLFSYFDQFDKLGKVVTVRVCRDTNTRRSLGYGYVNYENPEVAAVAIEKLNFTKLNEKSIRVMYSQRDNTLRKDGKGNIFIKNLDKRIDSKFLHKSFSKHGNILSCKVSTDPSGQSRGYGFVQYEEEDSAKVAIEDMNGKLLMDKEVFVGFFVRRQLRENSIDKTKFNNVYVKNLSDSVTDEDLTKIFGEFGTITSAIVMKDAQGKSKCFGFVNFEKSDDAAKAVEALNGTKFDDKEWYVGRAQKKAERDAELRLRYEQHLKEAEDKFKGTNLYIKNLDDSIDDDKLKDIFSPFGTVASCKVMRDPNGVSKGSGFVAFASAEEASRAMNEMKGKMIVSKPLYVALAERKEDRRARLQARFAQPQMVSMVMPPAVAQQMPIYPPNLGFYGQGSPSIIPPQPAFGYQHQLVPGLRPGGAPNFFVSMMQQGQQAQRPVGRRPMQQPIQIMQQQQQSQLLPRGRTRHLHERRQQSLGPLASQLADSSPERQRILLGENLYPLVEQFEPEMTAKVTGMLLEMDQTEVLHLLESPDALKAKVSEAMEVLRNVALHQPPNNPVDHIAGLLK
ncbi:hypothetical protein V2J09_002176 [Rumex salicifolius]